MPNKPPKGGLAFPSPAEKDFNTIRKERCDGMTLRDWFAGQAIMGLASSDAVKTARYAYELADALIEERERT